MSNNTDKCICKKPDLWPVTQLMFTLTCWFHSCILSVTSCFLHSCLSIEMLLYSVYIPIILCFDTCNRKRLVVNRCDLTKCKTAPLLHQVSAQWTETPSTTCCRVTEREMLSSLSSVERRNLCTARRAWIPSPWGIAKALWKWPCRKGEQRSHTRTHVITVAERSLD